jgi:flagellar biosynthesis GTPase FlhF
MLPNRERTSKLILSSVLLCALVIACDKKDDAKQDDKAATAEKTDEEKQLEERLAAKKAEREAAAKAEEDKANAVKALAELPEKMPKDLEAACKGVAEAQDQFMQKHYEGDGLQRWNEAKGTQMGMLQTGCIKSGNIEVAACQINAMNNAPTEYKNELPNILKACIEKFGGEAAAD